MINPILDLEAHVASCRRARVKVRRGRDGATDAPFVETADNFRRQDALQIVVWDRLSAVGTRHVHRTLCEASICVPLNASTAVPTVRTGEPHGPARRNVDATETTLQGATAKSQ